MPNGRFSPVAKFSVASGTAIAVERDDVPGWLSATNTIAVGRVPDHPRVLEAVGVDASPRSPAALELRVERAIDVSLGGFCAGAVAPEARQIGEGDPVHHAGMFCGESRVKAG